MLLRTLCLLFLALFQLTDIKAQDISRAEPSTEFKKQLRYHQRSLRLDPSHGPTYRARGILYYDAGDYQIALADFNRALAYKDSSHLTFFHKGLTLIKLGRPEDAKLAFEKAYQENPFHPQTLGYVGFYQLQVGDTKAAIANFNQALAIDSSLLMIRLNRGTAYYKLGKLEKAIEDMEQVIAVEPFHPVCLSNLGLALCQVNRLEEGLAYLDQALSMAPNLAEAWYNRGLARYARGELQDAMDDFRKAKSLKPELVIRLNGEVWEP
ncbi:MAG: tetratricopeptide repeat protein [Bacteroidia bacterium]